MFHVKPGGAPTLVHPPGPVRALDPGNRRCGERPAGESSTKLSTMISTVPSTVDEGPIWQGRTSSYVLSRQLRTCAQDPDARWPRRRRIQYGTQSAGAGPEGRDAGPGRPGPLTRGSCMGMAEPRMWRGVNSQQVPVGGAAVLPRGRGVTSSRHCLDLRPAAAGTTSPKHVVPASSSLR